MSPASPLSLLPDVDPSRAPRPSTDRAATRAAVRAARAIPPECSAMFAHLTLDGLRDYRRLAGAEEQRVSYWQSVVAARLKAMTGGGAEVDPRRLRPALARQPLATGRAALMQLIDRELPPLPDLERVWPEAGGTVSSVDAAGEQLNRYREELLEQVRAATTELIARYRQRPSDALVALPA